MPRYTRDEIISQGLDLAQSATVDKIDRPGGGTISPNAMSIKWLQNALDMLHRKYPFSGDVQDIPVTIHAGSADLTVVSTGRYLPLDWMLDVRDGVVINIPQGSTPRLSRLKRRGFQYWLNIYNQSLSTTLRQPNAEAAYTVINQRIKVAPLFNADTPATLWYYALPAVVGPDEYPQFPDEWSLIEFVRLKALEWVDRRSEMVGIAQTYLTKELARFKAEGLLNQTEYEDGVPIENNQTFMDRSVIDRNSWMGMR